MFKIFLLLFTSLHASDEILKKSLAKAEKFWGHHTEVTIGYGDCLLEGVFAEYVYSNQAIVLCNNTPRQRIYLQSVINHEYGHALGLLHSEYRNSVMYSENWGQLWKAPDDMVEMKRLFPEGER